MSFSLFSRRNGRRLAAVGALLSAFLSAAGHAVGLNDTGQSLCYDATGATGAVVACTDAAAHDDGRYGRDAAATAGLLTKTGAGAAGFDFTKIANNGSALAASAALGAAAGDWACTRDNVTGLTWEVKTGDNGLRHKGWRYTWYNTDGTTNGGNAGSVGTRISCDVTLPSNQCNTQAYVAAVNAAALCGYGDWRLPSLRELRTIVHQGTSFPSIDGTYFPNMTAPPTAPRFWSASSDASSVPATAAWYMDFEFGDVNGVFKTISLYVLLVRDEPF